MSSAEAPLLVDYSQQESASQVSSQPILLSSHQAGWENIHLAHYSLPPGEVPEISGLQHTVVLASWKQPTEVEIVAEGKRHLKHHSQTEVGCIQILPAHVSISSRWNQAVEMTQCYLEPAFLARIASESANSVPVDIRLVLQKPDPLTYQIILALKSVLETDANNSKFYAESMATALAAHFLQYYSRRKHSLPEYEDGLSQQRLKQAIEYINEHLSEDISLAEMAAALHISQYYFCRLFKQSTGMTPHKYLVQQRVERSKQLLERADLTINDISAACGFSNPSHFAKCFRQYTGISPKQFRSI